MYNVYSQVKTTKELWETLEKKYKTENASMKKFIVGRFLDYKMVDSKTVISQVQELQIILHELHAEKMELSESFQVAAIVEKLPPSWKDFKNYLKHKRKKMGLEDLIVRLKIEEDNHVFEKKVGKHPMESKANLVEPKANKKRKHFGEGPSQGKNKYKKFVGKCYICNKQGHRAKDCRLKGQSNENKTQVTEEEELANMLSALVLFEANMVDNPNEWWVDTSATRHVCGERNMFSTYVPVNGRNLIMGNFATSRVVRIGKVVLKITSRKELVLIYVLHVPDICKNLISSSMLSENGFKLVFESDKFVLMKNGMYVGKEYMTNVPFKMNVMTVKLDFNNNKASTSVYLIESFTLWHDRLGHVNNKTLKRLINMNLLPFFSIDFKHKCEVCVEAKMAKPPFHSIQRNTEPLDLIHSDICDLKFIQTRGGKRYFITFIDDYTRYFYVYLLRSKDEALMCLNTTRRRLKINLAERLRQ